MTEEVRQRLMKEIQHDLDFYVFKSEEDRNIMKGLLIIVKEKSDPLYSVSIKDPLLNIQ